MANFDVVVIGAGPGGYVGAIRAAQLGKTVCVVESRELGGTCLQRGCIPTKALAYAAEVLGAVREANKRGFFSGEPKVDYSKLLENKTKIVKRLTDGIAFLFKKNKIELAAGKGKLLSPTEVQVTAADGSTSTIQAKSIIIATGSEPAMPSFFPFDGKVIMNSDHLLAYPKVPESLLIIGGGFIGCEWAGIFAEFGSKVTIVEMLDQLLPNVDADVSKALTGFYKKAGIKICTKTKVEKLEVKDGKAVAQLSTGEQIISEVAMVSIGRKANTEGIGLETLSIAFEKPGIKVDDCLRTNVEGVYAIGDVTGKIPLAHVASRQAIVVAEVIAGKSKKMDYRVVPNVVFTHPEIATIGLTEQQAKDQGKTPKSATFQFMSLGRAQAMNQPNGFVKLVGDATTGEVLGAHIIGPRAADLIAEVALALKLECTMEEISETIHAHPTLPEAVMEASEAWLGRMIHG